MDGYDEASYEAYAAVGNMSEAIDPIRRFFIKN